MPTAPSTSSLAERAPRRGPALGVIVAIACVAQFMVVLDTTIVNVALPAMRAGLGMSERVAASWRGVAGPNEACCMSITISASVILALRQAAAGGPYTARAAGSVRFNFRSFRSIRTFVPRC